MKGRNKSFHPYASLTKAQALKIITSVANIDPKSVEGSFDDKAITRGELIKLMHDAYTLQQSQPSDLKLVSKKFEEARALWNSKKLTNYVVTQQASCFCMSDYIRPMKFSVSSTGANTGTLIYADTSSAVTIQGIKLYTVEDMFAMIQEAIDEKSERITVSYDKTYGYPISVGIDRSAMIADEEMYYTFTIKS